MMIQLLGIVAICCVFSIAMLVKVKKGNDEFNEYIDTHKVNKNMLCVDCKHKTVINNDYICLRYTRVSRVTGKIEPFKCQYSRKCDDLCGLRGEGFEAITGELR